MTQISNTQVTGNHMSGEFLDITADRCPMTFVRVRLKLDRMEAGQELEVAFQGQEPFENLPRSLGELGHAVLALEAPGPDRPGRLRLRRS